MLLSISMYPHVGECDKMVSTLIKISRTISLFVIDKETRNRLYDNDKRISFDAYSILESHEDWYTNNTNMSIWWWLLCIFLSRSMTSITYPCPLFGPLSNLMSFIFYYFHLFSKLPKQCLKSLFLLYIVNSCRYLGNYWMF